MNRKFTAALLIMGSLMIIIGYLLRPSPLHLQFDLPNLLAAHDSMNIWINSFRMVVFGLFLLVMGLVSLATLYTALSKSIVYAGVAVCCLALLDLAIAEGYYMHMGAWGGWKISTLGSPAEQGDFLSSLEATHEWVICLERMGYMFFCLGMLVTGWGIWMGMVLNKWLGMIAMLFAMAGMCLMIAYPSSTAFYAPLRWAYSAYFGVCAVNLMIAPRVD